MKKNIVFEEKILRVYKVKNDNYFSAMEIAKALGAKDSQGVLRLFYRHKKEISNEMTCLYKTYKDKKTIRLFNLRATHLLSMLSDSPKAPEFRKWVLDVLEKEENNNSLKNETMVNQKKEQMTLPLIHVDGKQILNEDLRMQTALKLAELAVEILKFNKTA